MAFMIAIPLLAPEPDRGPEIPENQNSEEREREGKSQRQQADPRTIGRSGRGSRGFFFFFF